MAQPSAWQSSAISSSRRGEGRVRGRESEEEDRRRDGCSVRTGVMRGMCEEGGCELCCEGGKES